MCLCSRRSFLVAAGAAFAVGCADAAPADPHREFIAAAFKMRDDAVKAGDQAYGAVVVKDGRIVGEGVNRVVPTGDPTAHAEIVAIRAACEATGSHVLDGAVLYTSCEPCPMCLGAAWWARVKEIVYANNRADAAAIGFDDDAIYQEVAAPLHRRTLPIRRLGAAEALEVFRSWHAKPDKVPY
jgi:guanine deaminase